MVFFLYRDILCIVGNILILIPFVDAIFFFSSFHFHQV